MAVILEKPELRVYEIRKRQHRKMVVILLSLSLVIAAILIGGIFYIVSNKKYTGYEVLNSIEKSDTGSAKYYPYGGGYIRVSRDGIMAVDESGHQLWNDTYQMKDPQTVISGEYACVSDRGSMLLQIYGPKGEESSLQTEYPIIKSVIASQGTAAVLLNGKSEDYIRYYSKEGKPLAQRRTLEKDDGFPMDFSISSDGTKLVTSYVYFNKGKLSNKITFFNLGDLGKNYPDNIVGAYDFGQTLVPDVEFINNNTVCAFGDDKFSIYSMDKTPEPVFEDTFKDKVKTVFYSENYIGFVLKNEEAGNNQVVVYDLNGKVKFRENINFDYSSIRLNGKEIILASSRDWLVYKLNGKVRMSCHFDKEIADILPESGRNRYLMVNEQTIDEVKLK